MVVLPRASSFLLMLPEQSLISNLNDIMVEKAGSRPFGPRPS